ncbi:MAG: type I DNA topoisomerase [Deltaproteobacteria bacterium]|nr:type I DNA topoisomerase [Deltaproteobacteria bacterium]
MKLLIVESPGKVKKIQSFLGSDWKVAASVGHVRDLPRDRTGVYPPDFQPQYEETERGQRVIADLKKMTAQAEAVYLATDPDREGEAIAWHLKEALGLADPYRVTYTEITEKAIKKALTQPQRINDNLVAAQLGRRVLDRLVGYSVSPAVTQVAGKTLSAGRVQTPALRLVVEREKAIRDFKSVTHYGVELTFDQKPDGSGGWKAVWNPKNWLAQGEERFQDKETATKIAAIASLSVKGYEEGKAQKAPPPPFTTSTLQQAASNFLKLDPKQTMDLAQKLYEAGHITYMRTDSLVISDEAIAAIRKLAQERDWPLPEKPRSFKAKKGAQEAHEAIRPTHIEEEIAGANELEQALYKLIWQRAVASQLTDAVYATAKGTLNSELADKEVIFEAKGRRLVEPGWKIVLAEDQADETVQEKDHEELNNPVPRLEMGSQAQPTKAEVKTRKTSAPPRYTQAALIRDLEKRGIGRPSTYAAIMENITSRSYIQANKKRQLESTPLGEELIAFLQPKFGFVDYDYTKLLEEKLDEIAMGNLDYLSVVSQANDVLRNELNSFETDHGGSCPDCGQPLRHLTKSGEGGYNFWACSDRDNCGARFKDNQGQPGAHIPRVETTDLKCPECGQPLQRVIMPGEGGYVFWACSEKDMCGARFADQNGQPGPKSGKIEVTDQKCPDCGQPLQHITKDGEGAYNFWACSDRLKCGARFHDQNDQPGARIAKIEVTSQKCPDCGQALQHITKAGEGGYNFWACSDRENCGARFSDKSGQPGSRFGQVEITDLKCPECGQPLKHLYREGEDGYNYWTCVDKDNCGARFKDQDGQPGEKFSSYKDTGHKCPECGQPLQHLVKEGPGGYNFWSCQDRVNCGVKLSDHNGEPGEKTHTIKNTNHQCPNCGQSLQHIVKDGVGGYNFWACSDRENCGVRLKDKGGQPGEKLAKNELTEHKCPDCGQPLRHIFKDGPGGYNFWGCSDRDNCGAKFSDAAGSPGEKSGQNSLSDHKCPDCGQPLRHLFKDGPGGYNFWACSDRDNCGVKYNDAAGAPGQKSGQNSLSDHKCPDCGQPLRHLFKDGPGGYNFWACSDRDKCGTKFNDAAGAPGPRAGQNSLSAKKCPDCGQPLRHLTKDGPGGYNSWACSDRAKCGAKFNDAAGTPGPRAGQNSLTDQKCPDCGQPLRHIFKDGPDGYNFWACSDRDKCGAKFNDEAGAPGAKAGQNPLTSHVCKVCGRPLRHLVKEGPDGYNFWACSDRACGTTYSDDNGQPKERALPSLSEFKCPACGQPLRHIFKDGPDGYNFWACSDRDKCGAKFKDNAGAPGAKASQNPLTSHVCKVCGRPLRHLVKDGPDGYNFWACSDRACGTTYSDDNGQPKERALPSLSEFKCPACQSPLKHLKGVSQKTGRDYNFFSCSNKACQSTYQAVDDKPVFPSEAPGDPSSPPDYSDEVRF